MEKMIPDMPGYVAIEGTKALRPTTSTKALPGTEDEIMRWVAGEAAKHQRYLAAVKRLRSQQAQAASPQARRLALELDLLSLG